MHVYAMILLPPADLSKPLLVLIAGPYQSGTNGDPACDAVLRIPGESRGADLDVARARRLGLPVYADVNEPPERLSKSGSRQ
jgi:hypothetical protein